MARIRRNRRGFRLLLRSLDASDRISREPLAPELDRENDRISQIDQRRRRSPLHLRAADGDVSDPRRLRPRQRRHREQHAARGSDSRAQREEEERRESHHDDGDCVCLDKTLSVLVCSDMQDCYIDVCSPEVLSLFEDNFDYQHLRRHFVKGVLVDDIMGYKIFTHEIGSSYAARVDNFRSYDTVSKDIIQRWTYPYVPDISFSGNRALKVGRQGVYKACDVVQSRSADGCYIWNDVTIEDGCEIGNAIVCDGVKIRAGAVVQPGAVLSFNVVVGRGFVVHAYSKVSLLQQPATEDSDEELEYADSSSGTANHLETESKSSWLGPDEAGYIWEVCEGDHDEEWKHSVAPIPKDKLDEITQAMDDDDDLEDESVVPTSGELKSDADSINTDVNDPGDEYGYFEREVEGTFLRAVEEGIKVELGILEINSLRLSYNMESADCAGAIFYSMMKLAVDLHIALLIEVIMKFEEMCQETARELGPLFAQILHVLSEKDVVQEDAILRWAEEKASADEADKVYLQQCESFIQWLKEASEEEAEDDDDEEDWLNCLLMDKNLAGDSTPRPKWRKVAYGGMQIGYNDNYTDETFLEEMVMNANVVRRDLLKVMKGSVSISQYLCIVALVVLVWVHTLESSRDENSLLLLDLSLLALGFLVLLLTEEKMLLLRYIANVSFFTTGLYVLAPVYQTLTRSISSDSIWAVTVSLLLLHLFLHDYSGSTIRAPGALKSPSLTSYFEKTLNHQISPEKEMKGSFSIVRQVFQRRFSTLRSSRPSALSGSARSLIVSPSSTRSQIPRNSSLPASAFVSSSIASNFSSTRSLCSSAGGGNGVVIVKSEEEFINAMSKAEGGSSPSIFYFTAVWCGPCRFIAPVIEELSKQYPDVTTYKIDIDEGGLSNTLSKLSITAVPTLQFFKEGSKKGEVVGADVAKLKNLMEQLYK
ncbi:hypothetical protein DY000_02035281 [Brassica cretica]|uniref:Thioredoxin domain-containing protein n=1 Tax=Brassica cretica TaxID=69181 RepID=A0ABQ7DFK0_BRACR|nr:hypothetical protein DY000_02035281 [Brassica cretica]